MYLKSEIESNKNKSKILFWLNIFFKAIKPKFTWELLKKIQIN